MKPNHSNSDIYGDIDSWSLKEAPERLKVNVCRKGHEYTPDNIIVNKSSGKRQCRTCRNQSRRLWQLEGKS